MDTIKKIKRNHTKSELDKFKLFFEYPTTEKEVRSDASTLAKRR